MTGDACSARTMANLRGLGCCARATTASASMSLLPREKREHRNQHDRDDDEDRGHHFGSFDWWPPAFHIASSVLLRRNRIPIAARIRERYANRHDRRRARRRREGYRERKLAAGGIGCRS